MTILFVDIRDFSSLSESMSPQENFNFLNSYLMQMAPVITAHGGIIDKYIGDAIMALFPAAPDDALRCSQAFLRKLDEYNAGRKRAGYRPIKVGIGINTGIVILGTIGGENRMDGTVIGDAVNLAARLEQLTKEYHVPVLISEYTLCSLENKKPWATRLIDRTHVRGKQGDQSVYEVFEADPPALRQAKQKTLSMFQKALAYYHHGDYLAASKGFSGCLEQVPEDNAASVYLQRCLAHFSDTASTAAADEDAAFYWPLACTLHDEHLDHAHRALLAALYQLQLAVDKTTTAKPSLLQIEAAAKRSFLLEEQQMASAKYPFSAMHERQHRRFFNVLAELAKDIANNHANDPVYLRFRVKTLLTDWLINHIVNADRHFVGYLRGSDSLRMAPIAHRPSGQ
jgi:hemerythrin